ncbi:MAG: SIMPL domain-containing protein [Limnochordaceae bacterium]|nr:SIMPL domain-containing protein [Limnochordaceae bacterium]
MSALSSRPRRHPVSPPMFEATSHSTSRSPEQSVRPGVDKVASGPADVPVVRGAEGAANPVANNQPADVRSGRPWPMSLGPGLGLGLGLAFALGLGLLPQAIGSGPATPATPVAAAAERQVQQGQTEGERPLLRIQVQGNGSVQVEPDIAYVWIGVETRARTAGEAQQENAQAAGALLTVLQKYAPKDKIKTVEFNLYQQQEWDETKRTNRPGDFVVTHVFSVAITDLTKVAAVLDEGIAAGANIARNVQYGVQDLTRASEEALQKAVADAIRKAKVMAAASGYEIVGLLNMNEDSAGSGPIPLDTARVAKFVAEAGSAPTPVMPGQAEVNATVHATFLARPVATTSANRPVETSTSAPAAGRLRR